MRTLSTLLLLTINLLSFGQDWALINPAYRYNYSDDGTDTISNQVFVTGTELVGPDSIRFALNRTARSCMECPPPCNVQVQLPQFLKGNCLRTEQSWTFGDPTELEIRPHAQLGDQWVFRPTDGTLCNVDQQTVLELFGVEDSVKRFTSEVGDTVVWSKDHGIVHWHVQGEASYTLIGIKGPDVGRQIPSLAQFFPYQPGDVVEYANRYVANMQSNTNYKKLTISSRTETDDQIILQGTMLRRWVHSSGSTEATYYANAAWIIDSAHVPMLRVLSAPPQHYVGPGPECEGYPRQNELSLVARHGIDTSGYYFVTTDDIGPITLFYPMDTVDQQCISVVGFGFQQENHVLFRQNLGLVHYSAHHGFTKESFGIVGARIDGVEYGDMHSNEYFFTGISDPSSPEELGIYPNPADGQVSVDLGSIRSGSWRITDITGKVVSTGLLPATDKPQFDVTALPPSVYVLTLVADESRSSGRFAIAR
jgi:hypothetical protein